MVKEGYKETEIGIIPEEWKVSYLNDFGDIIGGGTPRTNVREYWNGGIAWCTPSDITQTCGKYISETNKTITELGLKNSSANLLPEGTILLCTRATIGELKISRIPMATNQGFKNILLNTPNNVDYLYYLLQTKKNDMIELAIGTTFLEISKGALCKIQLQTPPIIEQKNIAEALSDMDNLISSLEKVIEKKKAIKQACLQKMFPKYGETTPEMRLPGYTEPWEQRKLGDMMNITSVKRIHQSDWTDSGVRFLRARDIVAAAQNEEPDDYLYISKEKYEEYSALSGKVDVSDLLVTGVGTIGVPYLVRNLEPLYFKDGNIIWFQNSGKIDGKFLLYSFWGEQIQKFINESAGIGTVGTYTIESGKKTPILFPSKMEQEKIGVFFQQLDNLITLHQRKLEKYKKIKQGMMQQLLTGKIRLL